jgi:CHAD domain-containing protein
LKNYLYRHDTDAYPKYLDRVRSAIVEAKQTADKISHSKTFETIDWRKLRVKIRHLDACKDLLHEFDGVESKNRILRNLSALLSKTNSVRDEQVLWETIPKKYRTPELVRWVRERSVGNSSSQRHLLAQVGDTFNSKFIHEVGRSVMDPLSAVSKTKFHRITNRLIKEKSKVLKSMSSDVRKTNRTSKLLHKFRIRSKELRYLLKLVSPELRTKSRRLEPVIEANQNAFGHLHDINNAIEFVKSSREGLETSFRKNLMFDLKKDRRAALEIARKKAQGLKRML